MAYGMPTRYPIRAVAKITGLSLDTLRAWERRYQAVVPERSDRGRQYGPEHIERLLVSANGGILNYHSTIILSPHASG